LRWYKRLIAAKFDGSTQRRRCGRPRVAEEVEQLVIQMATDNPTWGYRRLQGALAKLGDPIDKLTVRNILRRHHLKPAPQRRKAGMSWQQFLKLHWEVRAATDFCTVEVATWHGLVTYRVSTTDALPRRAKSIVKQVTWYGEHASVDCSAIIARQRDAMQSINPMAKGLRCHLLSPAWILT
jgi:hypothetical protein